MSPPPSELRAERQEVEVDERFYELIADLMVSRSPASASSST